MKKLKLKKETVSILGSDGQKKIMGKENYTISPCTDSIIRECIPQDTTFEQYCTGSFYSHCKPETQCICR